MTPYIYAGLNEFKQNAFLKSKLNQKTSKQDVINLVCNYFNVTEKDLISKSRKRIFVIPRQIAMYLIYTIVDKQSLVSIGKHFNRDHSTCVYANETVLNLIATDKKYRSDYNKIYKLLM